METMDEGHYPACRSGDSDKVVRERPHIVEPDAMEYGMGKIKRDAHGVQVFADEYHVSSLACGIKDNGRGQVTSIYRYLFIGETSTIVERHGYD